MSGRPGWLAAASLAIAVNTICLGVWYWNRMGEPVTTLELTERELGLVRGGEENSLLRLNLQFHDPGGAGLSPPWADSASFVSLGFLPDRVSTGHEVEFPRGRPQRRPAWVLLHLDAGDSVVAGEVDHHRSRLLPVAVGNDPQALLRDAPDPASHLVMRGVVGITRYVAPPDSVTGISPGETWSASLHLVTPRFLHVPRTLVPVLNRLAPVVRTSELPRYQVRLATGRLQMPWVMGVFPTMQ